MATYRFARFVRSCKQVDAGELVRLGAVNCWALSGTFDEETAFAPLSPNAVNVAAPYFDHYSGPCVTFGAEFRIGFDPESLDFAASTPSLGDLVIVDEDVYLSAHWMGGQILVSLTTGEPIKFQYGAIIENWWILFDINGDGTWERIFHRQELSADQG